MWPDEKWAQALSTLQRPLPVPPSDPGTAPTKTVNINCSWLPYIRGALWALVEQATWKANEPELTLAQMQAMTLISMFDECSGGLPAFSCPYDFTVQPSGAPFAPHDYFAINAPPFAMFIPSIGWNSVDSIPFGASNERWRFLCISLPLGAVCEVGICQMAYANLVYGDDDLGLIAANFDTIRIWRAGVLVDTFQVGAHTLIPGGGSLTHDFAGQLADEVRFQMLCAVTVNRPLTSGSVSIPFASVSGHAASFSCP